MKRTAHHTGIAGLGCILLFLIFPDILINPFIEGRISSALTEGYPGYTINIYGLEYDFWRNRVGCDSVHVMTTDSLPVFKATRVGVTGVSRLPLLLGRDIASDILAGADADAFDVVLAFPRSQHDLRAASVRLSGEDSSLSVEGLEYRPAVDDDRYFAADEFRRTRYRLAVPRVRIAGLACPGLSLGTDWRARAIDVGDAFLSVLVNKDKPENENGASPRMPGELLSSLGGAVRIDNISCENGKLEYLERFGAGSEPAVLTCDSIQVVSRWRINTGDRGDSSVIRARGTFMGAGEASVRMSIPAASTGLAFQCSGRLGRMNLSDFNPFLERSEHLRLKTGILESASFDIDVVAGRAEGTAHVVYEDLKVVAIEDRTGSESGVGNTVVSFFANNIKLRTTNMPDESDSMKVGEVRYDRDSSETFLEFTWFALRSGISDVVGF